MFVTTMRIQLSLAFMSAHPPILLDTVSMVDSIILMVMALVVFGPRRLPQIGRQIGKLMYEFRKASNDFKFQMEEELRASEEAERRKKEEERQRSLAALAASDQASVSADPPVKLPDPPYPSVTTEPVSAEAQPYPPDAPDTVASNETAPHPATLHWRDRRRRASESRVRATLRYAAFLPGHRASIDYR